MTFGSEFESTLDAARTGQEWALTALYRALHPAVLAYLRAREPSDAEDIAHEAWIDVAQGLPRFRGGEQDFRRFLFSVARRRLIDHRRREGRRRTVPLEPTAQEPPAYADAETEALNEMATEEALARIAALPPDQAEAVLLRVLGGFDAAEAGRIMGKRPGTVRVLQHRALTQLARTLGIERPRRDTTPGSGVPRP